MSKPDVLQVGYYPEWDQEPLDRAFTMHRYFEADDKEAFLTKVGPDITGIATRGELGADRAMIEACPNLQIISVYGVGYDAVELEACKKKGIRVTNTPDVLTNDVADLGVAMMLALNVWLMLEETSPPYEAHLEQPVIRLTRWGFPNRCEYDSPYQPEQEAGIDGTSLFAGFAQPCDRRGGD